MTQRKLSYEEVVRQILIDLTDVTGFDSSLVSTKAFQTAKTNLINLIESEKEQSFNDGMEQCE